MKLGGGAGNEEENDQNEDENEKEDIKNIMFSINANLMNPTISSKSITRGYHVTKDNIKKPLAYFKICNYCGSNENICECSNFLSKTKIIQNSPIENYNKNEKSDFIDENFCYFYKKKPPLQQDVLQDLKERKNFSLYQ